MKKRMKRTYGQMPAAMPEGYAVAVRFPVLAKTDELTGDGRRLFGDGGDTRDLPVPIMFKDVTSYGHEGARLSGALFEVSFEEDGTVSGRGFLLNDDNGLAHAKALRTKSLRGNSVDLAEVQVEWTFNEETDDFIIDFVDWSIAATTGVPVPAFRDAYGEIDDDFVASLVGEELVADAPWEIATKVRDEAAEITAGALVQPWEAFHQPEPATAQKLTVDERGWVSGHLATWGQCHDGIEGRCVTVPRPRDGYASFNKPGVLTDQGMVETGPIFLSGGHRFGPDLEQAYGGIENAWADVRVIEGRLGPWLSGMVRPGVEDEQVYAARASRISGHWQQGRLKAIVSVNAEGFDVPGSGFAFRTDADGEVTEFVAAFPPCAERTRRSSEPPPAAFVRRSDWTKDDFDRALALLAEAREAAASDTSDDDDAILDELALLEIEADLIDVDDT